MKLQDQEDLISKILAIILILVIAFVIGVGTGVKMSEAHEIPYPDSTWEANIYLKIKAQQAAIDNQRLDREIELRRLQIELEKWKKNTCSLPLEIEQVTFNE